MAKRGTRPSAPKDQRTTSTYIFGAICPQQGKGAGLVLPRCNIEAMNLHLAEIARAVAEASGAVSQVSGRMAEVSGATSETGALADGVRSAAGEAHGAVIRLREVLVRVVRTATPEVDRRRHPRLVAPGLGATLRIGARQLPVLLADLSAGGARLAPQEREGAMPAAGERGSLEIAGLAAQLPRRRVDGLRREGDQKNPGAFLGELDSHRETLRCAREDSDNLRVAIRARLHGVDKVDDDKPKQRHDDNDDRPRAPHPTRPAGRW